MKNFIFLILFLVVGKLGFAQIECLTVYTEDDIERLPSLEVEIIDAKIYVSTYYGGFYVIENGMVSSIDTFNTIFPDIVIRNISKFSDGLACSYRLGTTTTIYAYDFEMNSFTEIISNEDIIPNEQTNMISNNIPLSVESKDDLLLVGTTSGLLTYDLDGNYQQFQDLDDDGVIEFIFDIDTESDDHAWLCTRSGVFTMDYLTLEFTKITDQTCSQIVIDQNEEVVFTDRMTDKLYKYANSGVEELAQSNTVISFVNVQDFEVGPDNRLYFITPNAVIVSNDLEFETLFEIEEGARIAVDDNWIVGGGKEVIVYECPLSNLNEEVRHEPLFNIYPNLVFNELHVTSTDEYDQLPVEFSIVNKMGVEVLNGEMQTNALILDIDQLPGGMYLIVLKSKNEVAKSSFVKI